MNRISSIIPTSLIILCLLCQVVTSCHIKCAICDQGNCISCNEGFRLYNNECSACPQNCKTCDDNTTCSSCMPHFHGNGSQLCKFQCSNNCTNSICSDVNGYCEECIPGRYGPICNENCSLCRNAQCLLRSCSDGCDDGFVQINSSDYSYCFPCTQNCITCLNATYCTQCSDQYYIHDNLTVHGRGEAKCQPCLGDCTECSSILHCSSCSRTSAGRLACNQCKDGYVLEKTLCVKLDAPCPTTCSNGCDKNGMCLGDCIYGYIGPTCNFRCPDKCLKCETSALCASCEDGYYTNTCNTNCNSNCIRGGNEMCRFSDGYCLNGCTLDSWGETCEKKCSQNCRSNDSFSALCHRNGSCVYGCAGGFSGSDCSKEDLTTTTTTTTTTTIAQTTTVKTKSTDYLTSPSSEETTGLTVSSGTVTQSKLVSSNQNVPVAAIGGGVGGGVVLVIIIILLVCLVIRSC